MYKLHFKFKINNLNGSIKLFLTMHNSEKISIEKII